jgi:hypothetical protein
MVASENAMTPVAQTIFSLGLFLALLALSKYSDRRNSRRDRCQ